MLDYSIQCRIQTVSKKTGHTLSNLILLYNLKDEMIVQQDKEETSLKKKDILVLNPNVSYSCFSENPMYAEFLIDGKVLKSFFGEKRYFFICDSSKNIMGDYDRIKKILNEIMTLLYVNYEFKNIKLNELASRLVLYLLENFSVEEDEYEQSEKEKIESYIEKHFNEELSLDLMSEHFHMTSQYFSKYFKKHMKEQYLKYLTNVRLTHCLNEVVLTDKKFLSVAMDNGFSNLESFNRSFKLKYGMTPKEYRKKYREKQDVEVDNGLALAIQELNIETHVSQTSVYLEVDSLQKHSYVPYWKELLNLGDWNLMDHSSVLEGLHIVQNSIHFKYIRLELGEECYEKKSYSNFSKEENRFMQLYKLNFKAWLSIDYRLIKNIDDLCAYLKSFLSFITSQWSIHAIQEWYFEICYNTIFDEKKASCFVDTVNKIKNILKNYGCENRIVIAGLTLSNQEGMKYLYDYLGKNHSDYPVQSYIVEPYAYYKNNGVEVVRALSEINTTKDFLALKQESSYYSKKVQKSFVTTWKHNLTKFNIMNDSCYKGALIIKNFLNCFGLLDSLSPFIPFDAIYDFQYKDRTLFGGDGLLSYQGIKKPSFYAYLFFNHIGNWYLNRNEHMIVFKNDDGNYNLIAHNCKSLGYRYFVDTGKWNINHMEDYFEDLEDLQISCAIKNVDNGFYKIKKRSISTDGGSVQNEFGKMTSDYEMRLHPDDVEYLKSVSIPQISFKQIEVKNNEMVIQENLKANEFISLHIIRLY